MNLIISIHSAGYRRHLIQLKEKLLVPSKWMLIQGVFLACNMKDLYVFKAKWPLAVYYCCNCSCYLIYRYHMWAKGKCHRLSGITHTHTPLLGCWSHSFSNSQAQNINEVLQMSRPAISFCALSPFVTWNARSWMRRNHTLSRNIAFPFRGMPCCAWQWVPPHRAASTTG